MVQGISFGSTYKVSNTNNSFESMSKFSVFAQEDIEDPKARHFFDDNYDMNKKVYSAVHTLVVPDEMDSKVEAFCKANGIQFGKKRNYGLLNPRSIVHRIKKPEPADSRRLVMVDDNKLQKLIERFDFNCSHCKSDYEKYYKDDVYALIKKGDKFPVSTLYISPNGCDTEDILEYINLFGSENLNDGMISLLFNQATDKPDHCVYFALKDLAMKQIPVYVEPDTYKIGHALGIFTDM